MWRGGWGGWCFVGSGEGLHPDGANEQRFVQNAPMNAVGGDWLDRAGKHTRLSATARPLSEKWYTHLQEGSLSPNHSCRRWDLQAPPRRETSVGV